MTPLNRRQFLRLGATGAALGTLAPLFRCPFLSRSLEAAMLGPSPRKMLVIFLRGGCDGVNTVIPQGDSAYNNGPDSRPNLYLTPEQCIDLNGFAFLHPSLAKLHEVYLAGDLAVMHRIAYDNQSRSHFSSQQFWENAVPGVEALEEGWITRLVDTTAELDGHPFPAASISNQLQVLFRGDRVLAHVPNLATYSLGSDDSDVKLLGVAPTGGGDLGSGLLGVYSRPADSSAYDPLVRDNGLALGTSLGHLQSLGIDPGSYVAENGATYPSGDAPGDFPNNNTAWTFFRQIRHGVQILKETDCRIVGVELGGLDTHSNQGALTGGHPDRLHMVAHAVRSLRLDLMNSLWDDSLVVTLSEFGRTSKENASFGTDHGEASCMFVAGGQVSSQVSNCDSGTWADGDMFSTPNGRYVAHLTDFRTVLAEIIERHFQSAASLDTIIPGWSGLSGPKFDY